MCKAKLRNNITENLYLWIIDIESGSFLQQVGTHIYCRTLSSVARVLLESKAKNGQCFVSDCVEEALNDALGKPAREGFGLTCGH